MISDAQIRWIHLWLIGREPSTQELQDARIDMNDDPLPDGPYMIIDPRFVPVHQFRKHLLLYTSCHALQIVEYLKQFRPDVLDAFYVHVLYTHRMQLARPRSSTSPLIRALFAKADVVICNVVTGDDFGEFGTPILLNNCRADVKVVTFVAPCFAAFWPVAPHHGEEGIVEYMRQGKDAAAMIELFKRGDFNSRFDFRFTDQIQRLAFRERNRDVKISQFIQRHHKTHKMFFTTNHPTFNLIGYIVDEALGHLGFKKMGEEHCLSAVPVNGAGFGNHFPETAYEWEFYKFAYPQRFNGDYGGALAFYSKHIREAVARRTVTPKPFLDPEDDY